MHENTSPDTVIALVGNKIDMEDNKQVPTHVILFPRSANFEKKHERKPKIFVRKTVFSTLRCQPRRT